VKFKFHHLADPRKTRRFTIVCLTSLLLPLSAEQVVKEMPASAPVPFRVVSFYNGTANMNLVRLAHDLGFNEVQFQLEGSTLKSLQAFKARDDKEHYIDQCHRLGMKVSVWIHELSDIPKELGPISAGNEKLWKMLDERYEWVLGRELPDVDTLVLTVVETDIRITDAALMGKLVATLDAKCKKYGKQLVVRTFVWYPKEFEDVMNCVRKLPEDIVIMTKVVPQDWQMRGIDDKAIGAVGNHRQIIEYDLCGEYFQKTYLANCFPDQVIRQFNHGLSRGIEGVCARVDRADCDILGYPQEVNLWALGMAAAGQVRTVDKIWEIYANHYYGPDAASFVIKALKPTGAMIAEAQNVGPFTFGDTREYPPFVDQDAFDCNWSNWKWDTSLIPLYEHTKRGDPLVIAHKETTSAAAVKQGEQALQDIDSAKNKLSPDAYHLLRTKLEATLDYTRVMTRIELAYLRLQRESNTTNRDEKTRLLEQLQTDVIKLRQLSEKVPPATKLTVNGIVPDAKHRCIDPSQWLGKLEDRIRAIQNTNSTVRLQDGGR
jgi:hypothetical protein